MDRRQKKTREAIFQAFGELLEGKHYDKITVGEIIERADVGRATFYAHFETKDLLLKQLCDELFCHIFDHSEQAREEHKHIFECDAPRSVFLHLFYHMHKNDNGILALFESEENGLFLSYFKAHLKELIKNHLSLFEEKRPKDLPESLWIHHIASTYVETLRWWLINGRKESPETLADYFELTV
jgi:AcrR family transcriptional regulator